MSHDLLSEIRAQISDTEIFFLIILFKVIEMYAPLLSLDSQGSVHT